MHQNNIQQKNCCSNTYIISKKYQDWFICNITGNLFIVINFQQILKLDCKYFKTVIYYFIVLQVTVEQQFEKNLLNFFFLLVSLYMSCFEFFEKCTFQNPHENNYFWPQLLKCKLWYGFKLYIMTSNGTGSGGKQGWWGGGGVAT